MKRLFMATVFVLGVSTAYSQTTPAPGIREKTPSLHAFTGGTIIVSPGVVIANGTLLIDKGRVVAVGEHVDVPMGATVTDVAGLVIIPGFIDVYTDYGLPDPTDGHRQSRAPKYTADREGGSAWNEAIHAEKQWVDEFRPDSSSAKELIKQGMTVVQSARLDGIFQGVSFVTLLGDGLPNDLILRPNEMAFGSFDKGQSQQDYPSSLMGSIALIRQAFLDAGWYVAAQKAYALNDHQPRPEFNSALEALAAVTERKQKMLFAPADELSLLRAEKIGDEFGLQFFELGSGHEYDLNGDIASLSGRLILPVDFPEIAEVDQTDQETDYTLRDLRYWERAPSNPAVVSQKGVAFAFTSHGLKRKSEFLQHIREAVERGLSGTVALSALTTLPSEMLGLSDQIGTLEPGKLANFILANGNPLETKSVIYATWIAGQEHQLADEKARLFDGQYKSDWPDTSAEMSIAVDGAKVSGELKYMERSLKLRDTKVQYPTLYFSVSADSISENGGYRFSADLSGDTLAGYMERPDGLRTPWTAVRLDRDTSTTATEDHDSEGDTDWVSEPLISRRTFPDRAWGFDTLPSQGDVLIQNATVWTVEAEGIIKDCDILVKKGKFSAIGKDLTPPPGVRVIDAEGKHITPGIIDEHSHLAISQGVNEGTHAISAEVRIGDVINPYGVDIYRQLAGGVTCAQLLHGSANPIGGQSAVVKLRWGSSAEEMKFDGAGRFIKFALGENVKQSNWGEQYRIRYPQTRMGVEAIIRDEFIASREYTQKLANYKKLGSKERARTIPPRRDLQLEAVSEVLRGDLSIVCHAYVQSEMLMIMRLAEDFGIHVWSFIHVLEGYKVADELVAHGATATTFSDWWAYKFEVYDAIPYGAAIMFRHGVNTTVNSDDNDLARRLNTEAAKSIEYGGLTPEEAIKLVTINSAIQLKAEDRIGSIKVGKDADFVIWNDFPLSIYASPDQTWIDGKLYFDRLRDLALRKSLQEEKSALVQKALKAKGGPRQGKNGASRGRPNGGARGIGYYNSEGGKS